MHFCTVRAPVETRSTDGDIPYGRRMQATIAMPCGTVAAQQYAAQPSTAEPSRVDKHAGAVMDTAGNTGTHRLRETMWIEAAYA